MRQLQSRTRFLASGGSSAKYVYARVIESYLCSPLVLFPAPHAHHRAPYLQLRNRVLAYQVAYVCVYSSKARAGGEHGQGGSRLHGHLRLCERTRTAEKRPGRWQPLDPLLLLLVPLFFASLPLDTPNAGPTMLLSAILPPLTVPTQPCSRQPLSLFLSLDSSSGLDSQLLTLAAVHFFILHSAGPLRLLYFARPPCSLDDSPDR
ncbi:hypothetical protein GGI35DRAFT_286425 [Trichoderma velutinum]